MRLCKRAKTKMQQKNFGKNIFDFFWFKSLDIYCQKVVHLKNAYYAEFLLLTETCSKKRRL
ncbi:MAG: hypothetical protein BHW39_08380 [Firmicutes bacterium CAG:552_39_19]|nr:MAG: hypothetical protein BHW39_08380 [Firmicutes bacterium CAG:552_39_19]